MQKYKIVRLNSILALSFLLGACSGIPVSEPEPAEAIMFGDLRCTDSVMNMNVETVPCGDINQNYSHEKQEFIDELMAAITHNF